LARTAAEVSDSEPNHEAHNLFGQRFVAKNPYFSPFRTGVEASGTAEDAAYRLSVYVQISHFVTKVLIRKCLRPSFSQPPLTNLDT